MSKMITFHRGPLSELPAVGKNGNLYITTDEGAIYYGTGAGLKRLSDYVVVDSVQDLPASGVSATSLYYCIEVNALYRYDAAKADWVKINEQIDIATLKTQLGLGSMAYKSEVAESDLDAAFVNKINALEEDSHTHANKYVLDNISALTLDEIDEVCGAQRFGYDEDGNVLVLSLYEGSNISYDNDGNVVIS